MANIFTDAAKSFYSGTFYGELARFRKGIGLGMIVFLTILISGMMCINLLADMRLRSAVEGFPDAASGLPAVTLNNGKLSIGKPSPYRVTLGHNPDSPVVVIDTNYTLNDGTARYMREGNILALITADSAIFEKSRHELDVYEFKKSQPFVLTHEGWLKIGEAVRGWGYSAIVFAFFVSSSLAMFVLNLIVTVFMGMLVMVFDLAAQTQIEFPAAMRLAAAARIPINLLPALPVLFGMPYLAETSGWVLSGIYLIFAVGAVRLYTAEGRP